MKMYSVLVGNYERKTRFQAEVGEVYFVTKENEEEYRKTLFDDSEIKDAPCTYKSTSFCAAHIASIMVAGFNNFISNLKNGEDGFRILPFTYKFNFPLMDFKTEEKVYDLSTTV